MRHNIALAFATMIAALLLALSLPGVAWAACETFVTATGYTITYCEPVPTETPPAPPTATPVIVPAPTLPPPPTSPTAAPTASPTVVIVPPPSVGPGIWVSTIELATLPTSGAAWADLLAYANRTAAPTLKDQDSPANVITLAKGLAYARTGDNRYREGVVEAIRIITHNNTESGGRTLALGRELAAYIIAADLINLRTVDPTLHEQFSAKLRELRTKTLDSKTLVSCHEGRPNNWGDMCGASRAAIATYLGDKGDLERTALVFRGYLGDLAAYNKFTFGSDKSWTCDPANPTGVNGNCTKSGQSLDGALPEEMRRGGSFRWPPATTGYPWEALQGAVTQAEILHRAGYPAWQWSDRAVCRAVLFLYTIGWQPSGDDLWQIPLVNARCGTSYATSGLGTAGKIAGFTYWTHAAGAAGIVELPPAQNAPAYVDIAESRIVIGDSEAEVTEEVAYLVDLEGWIAMGEIQVTTDADGAEVYSQTLVR